MSTLTLEALREMREEMKAKQPPMLGGAPFYSGYRFNVVRDHWPQEKSHVETIRVPAHPIVQWLAKFLPIDPWVEMKIQHYRDCSPFIWQGTLFLSVRQSDLLKINVTAV